MLIIERLSRSSESNIDDTDLFNHQVSRKFVKQYFWYLRLTSTHVIYFRKNWQNEAKKQNFLKCLIFSGHFKKGLVLLTKWWSVATSRQSCSSITPASSRPRRGCLEVIIILFPDSQPRYLFLDSRPQQELTSITTNHSGKNNKLILGIQCSMYTKVTILCVTNNYIQLTN